MKYAQKKSQDVKFTMNFVKEVFNTTRWLVNYQDGYLIQEGIEIVMGKTEYFNIIERYFV
jgi:hypothetical protein